MRFRASCLAACLLAVPLAAQQPQAKADAKATAAADASLRRSSMGRYVSRVALSPDGATLAYSVRGREGTELHLAPMPLGSAMIDQSKDKVVTPSDATNCSNSDPVWAPDSKTLAYTSTCTSKEEKPGQPQLFLFDAATGKSRELTHVTGSIAQAAWSPDGKTIGFLFVENATRTAGALDAMKPLVGVIGQDTFEVMGVYGVNVATGKAAWIVPASNDTYVYEFDWAPDSKRVAYIGAHTPGENNWWVAKLYVWTLPGSMPQRGSCEKAGKDEGEKRAGSICSSGGGFLPEHTILDPQIVTGPLHGLQIAVPRWSPDGKRIAVIGGLMSDQGSTGGDVWVVDVARPNQPYDITPGIDGTPTWETWLDDKTVGFVEDRSGHILLTDADADKHRVVPNSSDDLGEVSVSGGGPIKNAISAGANGTIAYLQSGLTQGPEIWGGDVMKPGALHALTSFNTGMKPSARTESVEWENEGFHVQGWLTYPVNYDPSRKYPIIVEVHGGPTASAGPRSGSFAQQGYFEFQPNPRGSMGQGEKFVQANVKDFGYGDLRDILKGLDTIEAKIPAIDHSREGITGWSYGGYMTMFAVTQTTRFKAAIAGAGIANWQSYYGENSIDQWMIPFFGASVYDDPAVYAKSSPITFIKKVKTPTLVLVGERDGECPAPQSFEFWHALRDLGVKTELVVYPNEGHGFRDPAHIKDRSEREAKWFAENLK